MSTLDRSAAPARWAALFDTAAADLASVSPAIAHRCTGLAVDCRKLADLYRPRLGPIAEFLSAAEAALLAEVVAGEPARLIVARAAQALGVGVTGCGPLRAVLESLERRKLVWRCGAGQRLERTAAGVAALVSWVQSQPGSLVK